MDKAASVKILGKLLKEEKDSELRRIIVRVMGDTKSDDAVPFLLDAAKKDKNIRVRTAAVSALGEINTPKARAALMEILEKKDMKES
jgi:HEAT repeat protein